MQALLTRIQPSLMTMPTRWASSIITSMIRIQGRTRKRKKIRRMKKDLEQALARNN